MFTIYTILMWVFHLSNLLAIDILGYIIAFSFIQIRYFIWWRIFAMTLEDDIHLYKKANFRFFVAEQLYTWSCMWFCPKLLAWTWLQRFHTAGPNLSVYLCTAETNKCWFHGYPLKIRLKRQLYFIIIYLLYLWASKVLISMD